MFLDELDIFILSELYNSYKKKEIVSAWIISKKYFTKTAPRFENSKKEHSFFSNKTSTILARLMKLCKENLLSSKKETIGNKINHRFFLNIDKVDKCNFNFTKGKREGIVIKNSKEIVFEI